MKISKREINKSKIKMVVVVDDVIVQVSVEVVSVVTFPTTYPIIGVALTYIVQYESRTVELSKLNQQRLQYYTLDTPTNTQHTNV